MGLVHSAAVMIQRVYGIIAGILLWSGVRAAEGTALEMRCTGNRTVGSNPTRSVCIHVDLPALPGLLDTSGCFDNRLSALSFRSRRQSGRQADARACTPPNRGPTAGHVLEVGGHPRNVFCTFV